jgi:hypothetical protein
MNAIRTVGLALMSAASFCGVAMSQGSGIPTFDKSEVEAVANAAALPTCDALTDKQTRWTTDTSLLHRCEPPSFIPIAAGGVSGLTEGAVLLGDVSGGVDEDPANFFYDTSAVRLGLGTNAPGQNALPGPAFELFSASDRTFLEFTRASDSIADGDSVGQVDFYAGSTPIAIARIIGARDSATGGNLDFYTTPTGGSAMLRARIDRDGAVGIGIQDILSNAVLHLLSTTQDDRLLMGDGTANDTMSVHYDETSGVGMLRVFDGGLFSSMSLQDGGGDVGIGTTSPSGTLDVDGRTGVGVIEVDGSGGGCLKLQDTDDGGFTYCTALNGALSCSTTPC